MNPTPSYPEDRQAIVERCGESIVRLNAIAAAARAEANALVEQTGFVANPTLPAANYILSRMAKWERLIFDLRSDGLQLFSEYQIGDLIDCAELANIDLQDFIAFVRRSKFDLAAPARPLPFHPSPPSAAAPPPMAPPQPAPSPRGSSAAMPQPAGPNPQIQKLLEEQRRAELQALQQAQKASIELTRSVVAERLAQADRHAEAIRSLL